MKNIRLLDTTLRDGMYVTDFHTDDFIKRPTITALEDAGVEIIECGFLGGKSTKPNSAKYASPADFTRYISPKKPNTMYAAIIMSVSDVGDDDLPERTDDSLDGIRIAFFRSDIEKAVSVANKIQDKGYAVIMQPMNTVEYSQNDVLQLIREINALKPAAVAVVDSQGNITPDKTIELLSLYEANLCNDIEIDFHFHNNMQLAFANAITVLGNVNESRSYIMDASIFGMGRGAGNLPLELIMGHMNAKYGENYQIGSILDIYDKYYKNIFTQTPWGYQIKYLLAASHNVNSFYATLLENQSQPNTQELNVLLGKIPSQMKSKINMALVESLLSEARRNTTTANS